jgi:hypothetical protein
MEGFLSAPLIETIFAGGAAHKVQPYTDDLSQRNPVPAQWARQIQVKVRQREIRPSERISPVSPSLWTLERVADAVYAS